MLKFSILILAVLVIAGCGSASKTAQNQHGSDSEEIDELSQLLGLDGNGGGSSGKKTAKEQSTEAPKKEVVAEIKTPSGNDPGTEEEPDDKTAQAIKELEGQIQKLEIALEARSLKIDELFAELSIKDETIEELRNELKAYETGTVKKPQPAKIKKANTKTKKIEEPPAMKGPAGYKAGLSFKANYDTGLDEYRARHYSNAIVIFEQLLAEDKSNDLSDNCQFWIGESYFALGNYQQSLVDFQKVFLFSGSNKNDDAQFKIGRCYMMLGNKAKAHQAFNDLIANYPESEYVSKAQDYLVSLNE